MMIIIIIIIIIINNIIIIIIIINISHNYIDLRCLIDIKVLTQQTQGAAYCSWESPVIVILKIYCAVYALEQACATHGPRATIRPPRAIAVAHGDGRTVFFFYFLCKNPQKFGLT